MDKTDITALFANLLDNAVEACEESSIQCKKIILRIHRFKEYIVIKVCNTIGTKPKIKEGKLVSTKNGHLGMGMMILENLANKYCGNMDYEYSDTYFETNLILSVYNGMCER
nr:MULTISPECIES: GHKL domain-containing protein [Lachnospiraceae]